MGLAGGGFDLFVTEQFLHFEQDGAVVDAQTGKGMSHVVNAKVADAGFAQGTLKAFVRVV